MRIAEDGRCLRGRNVLRELMMTVNGVGVGGNGGRGSAKWWEDADRGPLDVHSGHCGDDWLPCRGSNGSWGQGGVVGEDGSIGDGDWDELGIQTGEDRGIEHGLLRVHHWATGSWQDGIQGNGDDRLLGHKGIDGSNGGYGSHWSDGVNESRCREHRWLQDSGRGHLQHGPEIGIPRVVHIVRVH